MRWRMVDRIDTMEPGVRAVGRKAVTQCEDYFEHHFRNFAIVPGTIMLESMAELGGRFSFYSWEKKTSEPVWGVVKTIEDARFYGIVRPGSVIHLSCDLLDLEDRTSLVDCEARVDDEIVATATVAFVLFPYPVETPLQQLYLGLIRADWKSLWDGYDL